MHFEIPITRGLVAIVDYADIDLVLQHRWRASGTRNKPYVATGLPAKGTQVYMHRLIMSAPTGLVVDHLDGNGLNNSRSNLRLCTHRENVGRSNRANRPSCTGYRGVSRSAGCSSFVAKYAKKYLGSFRTVEEAAKAYDCAAKVALGEFAPLNFRNSANAECAPTSGAEQLAF